MYVNDDAHRVSLVSRLSPSFSLSGIFPSHPVIPSRSVLLSSRKFFSTLPVLSIGQAKLCSRDDDVEGDPACSAAAVEQAGDVTFDTVVDAAGQEVGVIKGSVAAAAVDDVPSFAAVAVSQVGLGNCGFVRLHDTGFAEIKIL